MRYAESLEALILTREDEYDDPKNPSSILKTISIDDVVNADYDDLTNELSLSYRENERLLNIHITLYERDITPELQAALEL